MKRGALSNISIFHYFNIYIFLSSFSSFHSYDWDEHFFHGDATVLECVAIVAHVVVVVVGVGEETVVGGKHVACAKVGGGEMCFMRVFDCEHLLGIAVEVLT